MNLRATYFEQLESILAELASLIKRNEKLAKHNVYVKRATAGLKRIKKAIWRIVEYSVEDFAKPALKVFGWVQQFVSRARERVMVAGCQLWRSLEGKQLTLAECKRYEY
jgi:hypothetical protein